MTTTTRRPMPTSAAPEPVAAHDARVTVPTARRADDARPRTELQLAVEQVRGVEHLARWCTAALAGIAANSGTREAHLDAARGRDAVERQRQAMFDRLDVQTARTPTRLTAVLAHRQDWFARRVAAALADSGVSVLALVSNGADAVGVCAVEQPDMLLVEDQLPTLTGVDIVHAVQAFSPRTRVVAQVGYSDRITALLEAGAAAALTRQIPPADVARALRHENALPAR